MEKEIRHNNDMVPGRFYCIIDDDELIAIIKCTDLGQQYDHMFSLGTIDIYRSYDHSGIACPKENRWIDADHLFDMGFKIIEIKEDEIDSMITMYKI